MLKLWWILSTSYKHFHICFKKLLPACFMPFIELKILFKENSHVYISLPKNSCSPLSVYLVKSWNIKRKNFFKRFYNLAVFSKKFLMEKLHFLCSFHDNFDSFKLYIDSLGYSSIFCNLINLQLQKQNILNYQCTFHLLVTFSSFLLCQLRNFNKVPRQ